MAVGMTAGAALENPGSLAPVERHKEKTLHKEVILGYPKSYCGTIKNLQAFELDLIVYQSQLYLY